MSRIALVLGGGVSLGSYTGGAVTEIVLALERNRGEPCTVDVLAGASAGALTAGLAARALAVNRNLLPWIERVWVDAADAEVLLNPGRRDRSGLLDASAIEELSSALITAEPALDDRPSPGMGARLRLGIALSNLDGIRYELSYGFLNVPDRSYGTRIYRDWVELEVPRGVSPRDPVWERVREAAVASASFPFAFPPVAVRRNASDYPGARLPEGAVDREGAVAFWYTDGGLFHNEPVGLAKRLVEREPGHQGEDWRYILVDPYMESEPGVAAAGSGGPRSPADAAGRIARAVLGQSAALDWIRANKTNARLEILHALVERLPELADRLGDPEAVAVGRHIGELAERVAEMKVAVARQRPAEEGGDPVLRFLEENLARIEEDPRFAPVLARVETRAGRTRLAKLIFILEAAGGLRDKEVMPLYLVAPPSSGALRGDFMGNFGGFFHREWRAEDFRAGRRDARRLLETHLADLVTYDPDAPEAYETRGPEAGFEAMPATARRRLESFIRLETDRLMQELEPRRLASLLGPVWKPVVRRWATRRILDGLRRMA